MAQHDEIMVHSESVECMENVGEGQAGFCAGNQYDTQPHQTQQHQPVFQSQSQPQSQSQHGYRDLQTLCYFGAAVLERWMLIDEAIALEKKEGGSGLIAASMTPASGEHHPLVGDVREFVLGMMWYSHVPPACLLASLLYIGRIRASQRYLLTRDTFCVLFVTTLYVASKFHEDNVCKLAFWASISGFTVANLRAAERSILSTLRWELYHSTEELLRLYRGFEQELTNWSCGIAVPAAGAPLSAVVDKALGALQQMEAIHVE